METDKNYPNVLHVFVEISWNFALKYLLLKEKSQYDTKFI